jgi:hypothetical protein
LDWKAVAGDTRRKWTDRLRAVLRRGGKPMDDVTIAAIKMKVAGAAATLGDDALHESKAGPIISLA